MKKFDSKKWMKENQNTFENRENKWKLENKFGFLSEQVPEGGACYGCYYTNWDYNTAGAPVAINPTMLTSGPPCTTQTIGTGNYWPWNPNQQIMAYVETFESMEALIAVSGSCVENAGGGSFEGGGGVNTEPTGSVPPVTSSVSETQCFACGCNQAGNCTTTWSDFFNDNDIDGNGYCGSANLPYATNSPLYYYNSQTHPSIGDPNNNCGASAGFNTSSIGQTTAEPTNLGEPTGSGPGGMPPDPQGTLSPSAMGIQRPKPKDDKRSRVFTRENKKISKRLLKKLIREELKTSFLDEAKCQPTTPCGSNHVWSTAECKCMPTLKEQTWEGCQTIVSAAAFADFESAANQCCDKCGFDVPDTDPCYEFCEERCCEVEEPCPEPVGGCPPGQVWNINNCHCENEDIGTNPCRSFSQMNIASQNNVCNNCCNGTPNSYQSQFCDCCDCPGGNNIFNDPGKKPLSKKTINESRRLRARIEKEIFKNHNKK